MSRHLAPIQPDKLSRFSPSYSCPGDYPGPTIPGQVTARFPSSQYDNLIPTVPAQATIQIRLHQADYPIPVAPIRQTVLDPPLLTDDSVVQLVV
jgi:hypothetical protein